MKAKREFYLYGNDRKFHDDYIVSIMTGEPMPRKWQQFLELTPEEKARWDASLRLDAEYRIAEAQGFPNGIPGGKTRGNALYTFTQMEEERERNLLKNQIEETLNPYGQYFSPHKTDIQDGTDSMFGNITPADNLWQNPFDTWKTNLTAGISAPQAENKPAFDLRQAIQRLTESVRESMNRANQQVQTPETVSGNTASTGDTPIPTKYNNQQTMNNAVPNQASLQEKNTPPQVSAEEQTETQSEVPWMTRAIYAAKEEPTPQAYYIQPKLTITGTPSVSLTTASTSYQPTSHMVNLPGSSAMPLTTDASNTVRGYSNSSSVKAQGYGNGGISSGENLSSDEVYEQLKNLLKSLAEKAKTDLAGLAATIVGIITARWRFSKDITASADTMILVLGLCHVANKTQIRWNLEKHDPSTTVPKIFGQEAMKYLAEGRVGKFVKSKTESELPAFLGETIAGDLLDYLERNAPLISEEDVETWKQYLKDNL